MKPPPPPPRPITAGDNVGMDSRDGTSAWAHVVDVLSPQRLIVIPVAWPSARVLVCGKVSHVDPLGHVVTVSSQKAAT